MEVDIGNRNSIGEMSKTKQPSSMGARHPPTAIHFEQLHQQATRTGEAITIPAGHNPQHLSHHCQPNKDRHSESRCVWQVAHKRHLGNGDGSKDGRNRSSKRSTHARPGMHMQQCLAVPFTHCPSTGLMYVQACQPSLPGSLFSRILSAKTSSLHSTILRQLQLHLRTLL